jgi:alpha-D-xyloside xylohydrolase
MKFTDGFWRNRDDFEVFNSAKVYDIESDSDSITAYAPHFDVQNRGQTLWGPLLTYRFSSPLENVIRVQVWHFSGSPRKAPEFELAESRPAVEISDQAGYASLKSGLTELRVKKGDSWSLDFSYAGKPLTNSRWKNSGYVKQKGGSAFMKEELALGVGECVYGLGERFTPLVKNGQVVDAWNADGGTSSELSYKNIPFYLSNRGYGVLVNDPGLVSFEVGSEKVSRVQFSVEGEYLEYLVFAGPGPKDVLERYTALTGRPGLPPPWSFGLWLTTSFVTQYDEETVTGFIEGMAQRRIPLSVFHFDCFWMKEYQWCDFEWDGRFFPDPAGFLRRLKERGLRICVWINPYIAQRSRLFAEGAAEGFLLKSASGGVWQADTWQPGMGMVDFTNPGARAWFQSKLRRLVAMGVDCFKTDFGERIPTDVAYHDGSDPARAHNYYSYLYNQAVWEVLGSELGEGNSLVFARSATVGGQKFPVHWGGDCTASYESMAESLRGGLSLGLSGFGFWSHDISGFEHTATPDLYKRWAAFGLLSSHSRLHGNASYRVPWLFDDEACDVLRFFTRLKCSLMPYIWAQARLSSEVGLPMMRAMVLEYPDDPACAYLDRQYFLGSSLMVAPVFSPDGSVRYYLPEGVWYDALGGKRVEGGRWLAETHGYLSLPLMAREGSLIASNREDSRPDYDYAQDACLTLYGLPQGASASAAVFSLKGERELTVEVRRDAGKLSVNASGSGKPWKLILRGLTATGAEGAAVSQASAGCQEIKPAAPTGGFAIILQAD